MEELARLNALYDGFGYRELARIIWHKLDYRIDDKTIKRLWHHHPIPVQASCPLAPITTTPIAIRLASRSSNCIIKGGRRSVFVTL